MIASSIHIMVGMLAYSPACRRTAAPMSTLLFATWPTKTVGPKCSDAACCMIAMLHRTWLLYSNVISSLCCTLYGCDTHLLEIWLITPRWIWVLAFDGRVTPFGFSTNV